MQNDKEVQQYVIERSKELIAAATACQEVKDAARKWIDSVGTEKEAEETGKYIEELEADIVTVDGLISFAESEMGAKVFGGEEQAKGVAAHEERSKPQGRNTVTARHARQWKPSLRRRMRCWRKI